MTVPGKPTPLDKRDKILTLWQSNHSPEDIAFQVGVERATVFRIITKARAAGDTRAARRIGRVPAIIRRQKIKELSYTINDPAKIARKLGVTRRLVQIRLREALS